MYHLTLRVAWHDNQWNGRVCQAPSQNSYCVALDRVREERDDEQEDCLAGKCFGELSQTQLPPCKAESGAFMNDKEWTRTFIHPYSSIDRAASTHGHLIPTAVKVPPYSTFAVPFGWMLRAAQSSIDETLPEPLAPDHTSPFESPWVFSRERQKQLLDLVFNRLTPGKSLVFFYTKEGNPLGDTISRLIVGVGRITNIHPAKTYEVNAERPSYLMWDVLTEHSIRPDQADGFILPYHEYLEPTGDPDEDARRLLLLKDIAVAADASHMRIFSYAAELAPADIALSTLVRCLESVRKIREHGIAKGPWERREEWLNEQIAQTWKDRGPFPGLGAVLEALGMRLGTALALELYAQKIVLPETDPWPIVDDIFRGRRSPPQTAYQDDIEAVKLTWANLPDERRDLLKLLSRFALTLKQAKRWFDPTKRTDVIPEAIDDAAILDNPYRICECDLGDADDSPVSIGMIDRGMLPDAVIAANHPVPDRSRIGSPNDVRRLRAIIVAVLREAAEGGDTLLSIMEVLQRAARLDLLQPYTLGSDWPMANTAALEGVVEIPDLESAESGAPRPIALQLHELGKRERRLRKTLSQRSIKRIQPPAVDWETLLKQAIADAGGNFDMYNTRHVDAFNEQAAALTRITSRRLTVLIGKAGTGKTSVMGALRLCPDVVKDGILLLAPTGKARVRLAKTSGAEAMTVAQFLNQLDRYDTARQRPLVRGKDRYRKEKTVVIDEASMLTMDDMLAVFEALDQAHVHRIILVGDPNQLPPIGAGRPFADLVSYLENAPTISEGPNAIDALARLTVEVRTTASSNETSDTLRLASWYTREAQPVDADRVLSALEIGEPFNDLEIRYWRTAEELQAQLLEAFVQHLPLSDSLDIAGFDASLGLTEEGWVPFDDPSGAERWQILSPVRMHSHGVKELNRWVQRQFRGDQLTAAARTGGLSLGEENLVWKDKILQTVNQKRKGYDWQSETQSKYYIANGEVGLLTKVKGTLKGAFAGRPWVTLDYWPSQFSSGQRPLELAYALTVHKAQGSEFKKIFVVIPKNCRILSRELIYTALTRSRERLVLLIEGDNASALYDLTRPEKSETARRNTNLFLPVVREVEESTAYADHLIHRTLKGHSVRSKSELVISNLLYEMDIDYQYERVLEGTEEPGKLRPDFSFITAGGDVIVWEHLGMLGRQDYLRGWEWKQQWYKKNGFVEGENLFTSRDDENGGLDSAKLKQTALEIKELLDLW